MADGDAKNPAGLLGILEKTASIGTVVKTLFGLVAGLLAISAAIYQHFAKTSELRALQCSVVDQSTINNQVVRASHEVRTALLSLKQNLDAPKDSPTSTKVLAEELSKAVTNIQVALDKIDDARSKIQNESIKGERKC